MALANRDQRERFGFGRELSRTERTGGRRRVRGARRCARLTDPRRDPVRHDG